MSIAAGQECEIMPQLHVNIRVCTHTYESSMSCCNADQSHKTIMPGFGMSVSVLMRVCANFTRLSFWNISTGSKSDLRFLKTYKLVYLIIIISQYNDNATHFFKYIGSLSALCLIKRKINRYKTTDVCPLRMGHFIDSFMS